MARITLDDGRWLDMRPPSVNELLAIDDLPEDTNKASMLPRVRFWRDLMRGATSATSWSGDPGDLDPRSMFGLVPQWLAARGDAVPNTSGNASSTRSRARRSSTPPPAGPAE